MINIPKNCTECEYSKTCHAAYYGSSTCKHGKEINQKTIEKMNK